MNENAQWQMIKDSVLFALSSGFSVSLFHFYLKKNRLDVYCSVFLLFSRCIDHFICYSGIVYTLCTSNNRNYSAILATLQITSYVDSRNSS